MLQNSLVSYRHELFVDNFADISVLQQHGNHDDNVPVYHSRRLRQLIDNSGFSSKYVELPGKGHWFEGIMATGPMRRFYDDISSIGTSKPILSENFSIVVPSSGDMGTRGGIKVDQLVSPDQLGRINVIRNKSLRTWSLNTSNIHRFQLSPSKFGDGSPHTIEIDRDFSTNLAHGIASGHQSFVRSSNGSWNVCLNLCYA